MESPILDSRFIVERDDADRNFMGVPFPDWSRAHEYGWAANFAAPGREVLDAGCGDESLFKWHLASTCKRVVGVDANPIILDHDGLVGMVRRARGDRAAALVERISRDHPIEYRLADLADMRDVGTFDVVFCLSVLEHMTVEKQLATVGTLAKAVRLGGHLVATIDYPWTNPLALIEAGRLHGLVPAGRVTYTPQDPDNVGVGSNHWGLRCYRFALTKQVLGG